jgi:hypothetical protein
MEVTRTVPTQPHRFYDGGMPATDTTPAVPPDRGAEPRIVIERLTEEGTEMWRLGRRIAYADREYGELLVPADLTAFHTDLASVPAVFTWLVPKTGTHLPAALIHDGLVKGPHSPGYLSTDGHDILRADADRVLRDAMADTGTGVVRRWLVWSAVTAWTMIEGKGTGWSTLLRWRYRLAALLTILGVLYLGYCATFDLFDLSAPLAIQLPWMGDRRWWAELVGGFAGAVAVPLVLGLTWGRFWKAGVVAAVVLAMLIHVTIGIVLISLGYRCLEWLARVAPVAAVAVSTAIAVASALVVLASFF